MNNLIINELSMFSEVLGWTLIHSLWQIGLIAIALKIVLNFVPQRNAQVRYNLSLLSLLAITIWTGVTFAKQLQYSKSSMSIASLEANLSSGKANLTVLNGTNNADYFMMSIGSKLDAYLPVLSSIWLIGIAFLMVRLFLNYKQLHRLDQQYVQLPNVEWLDRMNDFCKQLGITRKVKLLLSERTSEPITFRHFRPVILLPVSMMTGLTAAQIETLLLHELAHIQRHDYLINLFQSVLEILFFFHPAVWWISRIVREEREHCCDDLVLKYQEHPMLYAEALLQIQANHYSLKINLAMSAKGNHKPLTTRIQRLFGKYPSPNSITRGTLVVFLVLGMLSVFAFSLPSEEIEPKEKIEAITMSDTIPEKVALVVNLDNEQASEISLVIDRTIAETQDVETLLEENGIKVDASEIKQVNIYGLDVADEHSHPVAKRVQDMEDLFDDEITKLVEITEEKENGQVDTLITFELEERPIKVKPIILEEPIEQNILPLEGEIIFEAVDINTDTIGEPEKVEIRLHGDKKLTDKTPLTIVDGKERKDIHEIDPNDIKTITVLKGEAALEKYGIKGRDGVVEITTKKNRTAKKKSERDGYEKAIVITKDEANLSKNPLIILNGEEYDRTLDSIDPEVIQSVNVYKGEAALRKYGEKGRDGVVEVRAKIEKSKKSSKKKGVTINPEEVITSSATNPADKPLIILDGKVYKADFQEIDQEKIATVNVLKDEKAIEKYGEKGKKGVVEITTKKGSKKANIGNDPFKIFPNPSDDVVRIQGELKQNTRIKIEIWDMKGALIQQLIDGTFKGRLGTKWDASKATPGTYIVKITMDGEVSSKKVVIK